MLRNIHLSIPIDKIYGVEVVFDVWYYLQNNNYSINYYIPNCKNAVSIYKFLVSNLETKLKYINDLPDVEHRFLDSDKLYSSKACTFNKNMIIYSESSFKLPQTTTDSLIRIEVFFPKKNDNELMSKLGELKKS
ncbi:hypothetical protein AQ505_08100 [Pedobacter sp. PACM 27299]|nr:hypothetical protein AQ505_08100 [Pedobacter sp. PACM 27299]